MERVRGGEYCDIEERNVRKCEDIRYQGVDKSVGSIRRVNFENHEHGWPRVVES